MTEALFCLFSSQSSCKKKKKKKKKKETTKNGLSIVCNKQRNKQKHKITKIQVRHKYNEGIEKE